MTNPCDVGMCDPSRCHDQDCMHQEYAVTNPEQKKTIIKLSENNVVIPINQDEENEDGNS
jgi:hypothetical protein